MGCRQTKLIDPPNHVSDNNNVGGINNNIVNKQEANDDFKDNASSKTSHVVVYTNDKSRVCWAIILYR